MRIIYRNERPIDLDILKSPKLSVAVVVACRNGQSKLNLLLSSLAVQNYPKSLINVYVVDDGSSPRLTMPKIRPVKSKLIFFKNNSQNWGKTQAVNQVIRSVKEDVIWCVDSDMVFHPDHLSHMMKWHHDSTDYLVLGWKRFVSDWDYSPAQLAKQLKDGNFSKLHKSSQGKESWESLVSATNQLQDVSLESFRALVGATFSISRNNWNSLGGYNPIFKTGEDTELGWRVLMSGMRMVPESKSISWHLGISTVDKNMKTVIAHNQPLFANYIPPLKYLRKRPAITWQVPENKVIIDCRKMKFESFNEIIDQFLSDSVGQAKFKLLGNWSKLKQRYQLLNDECLDLRAIMRLVQDDKRFDLVQIDSDINMEINELLDFAESKDTPFIYYIEGNFDRKVIFKSLRQKILRTKNGLEGFVDALDQRAFILYTPALNRARRSSGNIYENLQNQWGIHWSEIGEYTFTKNISLSNLIPMISMAFRSFLKIRNFRQFKYLVKRAFLVVRNSIID